MIKSIGILLVNTDRSDFAKQFDSDEVKFKKLLIPYRPDWKLNIIPVIDNIFPDAIDANDAYIITGSPASVNDSHSWIPKLYEFIRELNTHKYPTIGICFGHQVIANALGGKIASNPSGWSLGMEATEFPSRLGWMQPTQSSLNLYSAHTEQVIEPPNGTTIIGTSANCHNAAYVIDRHIMTTQYHPEMSLDFISNLVEHLQPNIPKDVFTTAHKQLTQPCHRALFARWMVTFLEQSTSHTA